MNILSILAFLPIQILIEEAVMLLPQMHLRIKKYKPLFRPVLVIAINHKFMLMLTFMIVLQ
ncbi:Uncharacterised protein [Mycobacteroides abscessus subsp. abscessus]|nr:Uncharacterised protein [Mycobacteroides abscessus subsp. abscessus]